MNIKERLLRLRLAGVFDAPDSTDPDYAVKIAPENPEMNKVEYPLIKKFKQNKENKYVPATIQRNNRKLSGFKDVMPNIPPSRVEGTAPYSDFGVDPMFQTDFGTSKIQNNPESELSFKLHDSSSIRGHKPLSEQEVDDKLEYLIRGGPFKKQLTPSGNDVDVDYDVDWNLDEHLESPDDVPLRETISQTEIDKTLPSIFSLLEQEAIAKDEGKFADAQNFRDRAYAKLVKYMPIGDNNPNDILDFIYRRNIENWSSRGIFDVSRENASKYSKLNNRLQKIAAPIIQETGEGIDFRIVKPRQPLEGRTYGFHKVPIHPSNTILIRPKNIEHQMPLIKHFRNIQNKELGKFVQGSVQQYIPLRNVGGLSSPFGGRLKDYADISKGVNQELKKGDILMRRVGGDPSKGKGYGQVGDTFYITKDSPKGELFKYESKYKRNGSAYDLGKKPAFAKLNKRLQKTAERYRAFTNTSSFVGNMRYDQDEQEMTGILSGKHYKWCGVPERTFDAFQGAGSAGAFFNRNVKGQFDCSSGGILTEGQSRISKLKQRVAVIEPLVKKKKKGRIIKKVSPRVAMQNEISKETIRRIKNNKQIPKLGLGEGLTYIADIDRFVDGFNPEDADFLNKRYPGEGKFLAIISTTTNIDNIDALEPYHARLREKGIEALTGFYRNTQTGKLEFDSSYAKRFNSLDEIDPELQVPTEKSPTGQESALVITPDNKAELYFNKKYDPKQVLP